MDRWVAIKILAPERVGDARFSERFAKEAQILARLAHPNIVTVFDYGETDGLYYIVMEFVDGVNLRDLLRDGKLDPTQALGIVPPICEALQFAHDSLSISHFLPVLFSAATGSILGWRAAIQIRKSEGKLYGKRLAVFTGMVVPSLFVIPLVGIAGASLKELFASSPQFGDATALLVGTATVSSFCAIAFLGLRTCFRYLAGRPLQCYSKRILTVAGVLVGLWIVSGTLLWVQRPKTTGIPTTAQSPSGSYSATATTFRRNHVFGPDLVTHRFELTNQKGEVLYHWEMPVPPNSQAISPEFNNTGVVRWEKSNDGTIAVSFIWFGETIHKITVLPNGIISGKTSD
ncbi:MAG: protein kinase [Verrucomicrobiales bacterium]